MNTAVALVLTTGLVLAACGTDDDATDDASTEADEAAEESGDADGRAGDDAEFDAGAEMEMEEEAMEEEASDDSSEEPADDGSGQIDAGIPSSPADAEGEFDDAAADRDEAADETSGGGLFDEGAEGDAEGRFDDNRFADYGYRDFVSVARDPLSTFALDVDTGSYTVGRRFIDEGALPPRESVRPEEYINAFDYDYATPRSGLELSVDGGPSPFDSDNVLVRIGVQGEVVADEDRGPAALTFVIDTSGSMDRDDRLGLVKESLEILVDELDGDDTVAIVTYSDSSGIVLEPTPVRDRDRILDAIDALGPGGSTNLESGLREGYALAREGFDPDGINRVVLASDGVANAGVTDPDELARMLRDDADAGIDLVTVGFGMGNFNDITMEQLADNGDGFYAYVDTRDEAERLFEDELTSTLLTIAKDAKIQVEFAPAVVVSYRLFGFENRVVRDSDFDNDDVDAGELGAGHQVTAIYELELADGVSLNDRAELGVAALRWEDPDTGNVTEVDEDIDTRDIDERFSDTADDFQLATVVAVFAEKLRDNPYADDVDMIDLSEEADRLSSVFDSEDVDELSELIADAAMRL
ncbi:MAG: von Willebrand factor type A domain-containing protein [Ilumatobacter sp.]